MNKKNIFLLLIFVMSIFMSSCAKSSSGSLSAAAGVDSLTAEGGEWVLKIDNITVYENKFNKEFNMAIERDPNISPEQRALYKNNAMVKQQFLDGLISQILLLNQANSEGFFETDEAKEYLQSTLRMAQLEYYSQKLMEEALLEIPEPTQQQIETIYQQNQAALAQRGITELNAQTIPYLSQMMKQEQAQQKMMITISDLKDKSVIDRNKDVIGDIAPTQTDMGIPTTESDVLR